MTLVVDKEPFGGGSRSLAGLRMWMRVLERGTVVAWGADALNKPPVEKELFGGGAGVGSG